MSELKYTCYKCKHVWWAAFEEKYGAVDDDCPECESRHNQPELIEANEALADMALNTYDINIEDNYVGPDGYDYNINGDEK